MKHALFEELSRKSKVVAGGRALREITLSAINRQKDNLETATTKRNLFALIRYTDSSITKPLQISKALAPHDIGEVKIEVPDLIPIDVYFYWEEKVGAATFRRGSVFTRDSQYVGHVWNDALIFWDLILGDYEYANGGITFRS